MKPITIHVMRMPHADAALPLPRLATTGAAGADICANFAQHARGGITLAPMERALIPTGLAMAIPSGFEVQVRPRSGLALKHGVTLVNAPGTIDSDYRGEIGAIVVNLGHEPFHITHGMRIAQLVVGHVPQSRFEQVETLDATVRATGGFGSTGTAS